MEGMSKEMIDIENRAAKCHAIIEAIKVFDKMGTETNNEETALFKMLKGELDKWITK